MSSISIFYDMNFHKCCLLNTDYADKTQFLANRKTAHTCWLFNTLINNVLNIKRLVAAYMFEDLSARKMWPKRQVKDRNVTEGVSLKF